MEMSHYEYDFEERSLNQIIKTIDLGPVKSNGFLRYQMLSVYMANMSYYVWLHSRITQLDVVLSVYMQIHGLVHGFKTMFWTHYWLGLKPLRLY